MEKRKEKREKYYSKYAISIVDCHKPCQNSQ
jgi:hypothetical protein